VGSADGRGGGPDGDSIQLHKLGAASVCPFNVEFFYSELCLLKLTELSDLVD
jgi:hypothetical protein